jgi:hypothetical protein
VTLHDQLRHTLARLVEVASVLDSAVEADAGQLPPLLLARLLLDLDRASGELQRHAEGLTGL